MTLPTRAGVPALAVPVAAALAATLAGTCLALLPISSASAAGQDPTPPNQAAAWVKGQLQGGVLTDGATPAATDFGASLDAATGYAVLGDTGTAGAIRDALTPQISTYVGIPATSSANALARTVFAVRGLGGDPTTYGGADRVAQLQDQVTTATRPTPTAPATTNPDTELGKLFDDAGTPAQAGPANVVGQAYAAGALPTDTTVLTYLLRQQCTAGFLTQTFAATGQTCDSTLAKTASVEATASAVIALTNLPAAAAARDRAVAWLTSVQQSNGRWTPAGTDGPGDAVTTGLAAYALALAGKPGPAAQGAVWLRGQQLVNAGSCAAFPAGDVGAVTNSGDPAAVGSDPARGLATYRRATARSLAALRNTPAGDLGTANAVSVARFSKPGKGVVANVRSSARNVVCATVPGSAPARLVVAYNGTASYAFFASPADRGTVTTTIVDAAGQAASATVTTLAKKKLAFSFRAKRVRSGKIAVVKVRGLAPGENVRVQFRGKRKDTAVANASGQAKLRFIATGRGYAKVRVAGEYSNRNRTKNLIVVRR